MENTNKSDYLDQNNEDEYYPLEDVSEDVSDDDLDLSELLRKYMPEEAEHRFSDEDEIIPDLSGAFAEMESLIRFDEEEEIAEETADGGEFAAELHPEEGSGEEYAAEEEEYSEGIPSAEGYAEEDYSEEDYDGYEEVSEEEYAEEADASLEAAAEEIYGGEYSADEYSDEDYIAYEEEYDEPQYGDPQYGDPQYGESDYGDPQYEEYAEEGKEYGEEPAEEPAPDFVNYEEQEEELDIDENIDSTDINLMLAFGLDDELERTMGPDVAKKLTAELDEEQRKRDEKVRKTVDGEYMNRTQTAGFAKEYKSKYRAVKIKLGLSLVFAAILFFYENLKMFGYEFSGALDGTVYPTVYIMVSLQILLFCAACAGSELIEGIKNFFTGRIEPRSVSAVTVIMAVVHSAVQTGTVRVAEAPTLLNFAAALTVVFTLVAEYFNIRREIFAFNIVSSKRPKHIVTKIEPAYGETLSEEEGDLLKFESASFIDGFFTRTKEPTHVSKSYAVAALVIALISALIAGIFSKFAGSDAAVCVDTAFTAFFIAIPASMLITMSYPFYRASRDAYDNDGAIIGECSLEEYSDAGCVAFDDVGVFPSYGVRVQNVKIYNNHRIDRVLFYASSAFSVARGPLTDVFEVATMEIGHSDDVRIKAAGSGYLAVTVDEKNITFGTAAELVSRGFWIPESVTDEDEYNEDDVSVMYMFREEKLMAKMLIKYTLDSDFESIMSSLCEEGISVSIKTYDPNIDDELIGSGLLNRSEYSYSVTRYDGADDGNVIKDNADSGIVSRGSAKTLLQLIYDCTKVLASRRAGITIGIISSVVSLLLMLVAIISGRGDSLSSAVLAVYQLFWMIPTFICARMYVR